METNKTINSTGKILCAQGELRILSERNGWKQKVELWLLNDKTTRNGWRYENLAEHAAQFAGTPILVAYVGKQIGDGHNFDEVYNADGTITASFMSATAERIVGYFANEQDIRIEKRDGETWIVGQGYLWQWYAQELVAEVKKQGLDGMSISIETLVDKNAMRKDGDVEVYPHWTVLGTTVLGEYTTPAVASANIRALSAIGVEGLRQMTQVRVNSEYRKAHIHNPQNKNKKGETNKMNKTFRVEDLRDKFTGYTVLAVNGLNVALLSDNGRTAFYAFNEGEETVVPERIVTVAANSVFGDGDNSVTVGSEQLVGVIVAQLNATKAALDKQTTIASELTAKVNKMVELEVERRKEAAKTAIKEQLSINNADRADDEKIADDACDELLSDEHLDAYAHCEDKDGKWCGDVEARRDVDAKCMAAIREIEKKNASLRKNSAEKRTVFDLVKINDAMQETKTGLAAAVARANK